jgi:asparagine synthase (glutamine-hydrolysing)
MSGIYGIYRYDGAPVDPQWLERMKEAMAYYGPDGGACQIDGPVGMGHLLLKINPEDDFEKQPVRGERGLLVSAARLDNRDALLETFNIPASEAPHLSDGHLVSLAFDRWGEELCSHLEGDWALAAWDERERRLYLARDVFGMGALYYYRGKGYLAFASSLKALLSLPDIQKEPDYLRLAEVLVGWHYDAELTAYKGFRSVVGARLLAVSRDGELRARSFWSYGRREPLRYRRDEDYVEAFLEHYTRAVQSCLRSQKPIAAELSGGRDSGSVVALAAPILAAQGRELTAYTSVPWLAPDGAGPDRLGNEWDLAHATATMAGANVRHFPVDARDYRVISGIEDFLTLHDGPAHGACNQYWAQAVLEACSRSGARVVLTGRTGNATVSWSGNGFAILALRQGFHGTALRLLLHGEANPWLKIKRQILKPLLTPGRRLFRRYRHPLSAPWQFYSALNVEMAKRLGLHDRMRAAGYDQTFTPSPWEDLRSYFFRPEQGNSYGTSASPLSETNARHSISCVDPTVNLKLFEFLLRVPDDQFYRNGQGSFLIQRAFRGRMPELVLKGKRKGLQAADVGHRIVRERAEFQQCLLSLGSLPEAREMLDLPLLRRCFEELLVSVNPETTFKGMTILTRGIGVGLFLRRLPNSIS